VAEFELYDAARGPKNPHKHCEPGERNVDTVRVGINDDPFGFVPDWWLEGRPEPIKPEPESEETE
jgi:hypothetical protein